MHQSGHGVARDTDNLTFYEWLDQPENAELRAEFNRGMEGIGRSGQRLQASDLRAYPWAEKLGEDALIVDVGGSIGRFSRDLATLNPDFSIVVQDLPSVIGEVIADGTATTTDKVAFQIHNFFDPQPVVGADAYFFRHVFHNHPDEECVLITAALLPALKPGARVLVSEYIVQPYDEFEFHGHRVRGMRQMDLLMMALYNSKQRTKDEFAAIFQQASPDLVLTGTYQLPEDPRSCVFEATYKA